MRNIDPAKYPSDEGFVAHKIEIGDEDLEEIIRVSGGPRSQRDQARRKVKKEETTLGCVRVRWCPASSLESYARSPPRSC